MILVFIRIVRRDSNAMVYNVEKRQWVFLDKCFLGIYNLDTIGKEFTKLSKKGG